MGLRKFLRSQKKTPSEKTIVIGDFTLHANYEHPIADYLAQFPYYSRNLSRIAKYIEDKYTTFQIIDVGANIGDSVALLRSAGVKQFIHLFEGDPTYLRLLQKNTHLFQHIKVHETYLGEETSQVNAAIDNSRGTAHITTGVGDHAMNIVKLDTLVADEKIENVKLLKTDTDGFDFKVLRGAFETIKKNKPVLFFEYDSVFLTQQGDDGLSIFKNFQDLGYRTLLYYDNFGKFILSATLEQTQLLEQLYRYIKNKESAFPYYDIVMFHQDDDQLAQTVIEKELKFFE